MPNRYSRRKRDSLELREHRDETPGTSVPGVFVFELDWRLRADARERSFATANDTQPVTENELSRERGCRE